jgi:GGDEF domain-containing protein
VTDRRRWFSYLRLGDIPADIDDGILYCDPLTSLVAYPSFEQYMIEMLPLFAGDGLHVAIGDVDGLREYVSERRSGDPASFGHLAGNACMRTIGRLTTSWATAELGDVAFQLCGTFGGDEVIVAASGLSHKMFADKIHALCRTIKVSAPRPCSFTLATLEDSTVTRNGADDAYRRFVSMVDARLFHEKEQARRVGGRLDGSVTDLGIVSLLDQEGAGHQARIGDGR